MENFIKFYTHAILYVICMYAYIHIEYREKNIFFFVEMAAKNKNFVLRAPSATKFK